MDNRINCLDHGFVELLEIMGNDDTIIQSARVSTNKDNIEKNYEKDRELLRYLVRNKHTSPLEMVETRWMVKLPIFVARQWIRHRTASVNEISGRYSILESEFYIPSKDRIQGKGKLNKQGSEGEIDNMKKDDWLLKLQEEYKSDEDFYKLGNDFGIANELSRINLPVSTYTRWIWKIDLHNLFHFLKLRLSPHAQYEIRVYGEAMYKMLKEKLPVACEAFEDYILNAVIFSKQEIEYIRSRMKNDILAPKVKNPTMMPDYSTRHEEYIMNQMNMTSNEFISFKNKLFN